MALEITNIEEFKNRVFSAPESELTIIVDSFESKITGSKGPAEHSSIFELGISLFDNPTTYEEYIEKLNWYIYRGGVLQHACASLNILGPDATDEAQAKKFELQFNRIFEIIYHYDLVFKSFFRISRRLDENKDNEINIDLGLERFTPYYIEDKNGQKKTSLQQLLEFFQLRLLQNGYRREGDKCMKRIFTKEGYDTHAWEPVMKISEFVRENTKKSNNETQWLNVTAKASNANDATKYLETTRDEVFFPDVKKERRLFSFRNGIYETCTIPEGDNNGDDDNDDEDDDDEGKRVYTDCWYPHEGTYQGRNARDLLSTRCACKYFNRTLDIFSSETEFDNWRNIKTPLFDKLLDNQHFPQDVRRWMFILCGRLLYKLNELDGWQVLPFLKGKAGTGKSTIVTKVCKRFFADIDVGTLSNDSEKTFALSAFANKLLWIGPEIKENIKLSQAEFQQIISGEDTSIAEKFKTAESVEWSVPGIIAGNQPPGYSDNQGSVSRRLIIFEFAHRVVDSDTRLGSKLQKELPKILVKCNKAYLEAVNEFGQIDLWKILPRYFIETREIMAKQTNCFRAFLDSENIKYGSEDYVCFKKFKKKFNEWCSANNLKKPKLQEDFVEGAFEMKGLKLESGIRYDPEEGRERNVTWVIGASLVHEFDAYGGGGGYGGNGYN